ncbi:hypothetical protein HMPREF0682_2651 [Propionibacterium acidifaciens F0233]|uniref:Uncharacterized protein n=1 Tax=Propionibacterium acidifaciens F0233 TaxID=553198 RepID=U2QCI8_9ACTN|nr:hypothetical protein HMPREF0682_2651 [Propionibacterium acidifaciens F0233]
MTNGTLTMKPGAAPRRHPVTTDAASTHSDHHHLTRPGCPTRQIPRKSLSRDEPIDSTTNRSYF